MPQGDRTRSLFIKNFSLLGSDFWKNLIPEAMGKFLLVHGLKLFGVTPSTTVTGIQGLGLAAIPLEEAATAGQAADQFVQEAAQNAPELPANACLGGGCQDMGGGLMMWEDWH